MFCIFIVLLHITVQPSCQCGGPFSVPFPINRIINGFEVPKHSVPYQVLVLPTWGTTNYPCSGTLISPNYVLTAAECTAGADSITVALGDHNTALADGEMFYNVTDILIHPLWNPPTTYYDYAILRLNSTVAISPANPFVGLACLPPDVTQTFNGTRLTLTGWGSTNAVYGSYSPVLKAAILKGVSQFECENSIGFPPNMFGNSFMCASGSDTNSSNCYGDSGGKNLYYYFIG